MKRELLIALIVIVTGTVLTVANLVIAFEAEGAPGSGPSSTYIGPVIVFLGLVALGQAQRKKALDRR